MKLSQLGEFGLIKLLSRQIGKPSGGVIVGVGDDCAVLEFPTSNLKLQNKSQFQNSKHQTYLLITTDTLVENVHFRINSSRASSATTWINLGYKAMLANISDIAAMGGWPTYALVTIGAPGILDVASVTSIYKGIGKLAKKYGIQIAGGDTIRSPKLIISITLLGEVEEECLLLRSGARVGDLICVTGKYGGAAASNFKLPTSNFKTNLNMGRVIAKSQTATSMIDSSDGLVRSVLEICKASKVGARINLESVPRAKGASLEQALYGGEEYELVFTVPGGRVARCCEMLREVAKVTVVGEIVGKKSGVKLVGPDGKLREPKGGFEHFK